MRIAARCIAPGRAQGRVLVSTAPFSFVGGVDPVSGSVQDAGSGVAGQSLGGSVFAFPTGKGSTVGSYVIYGMAKRGTAPAALVNERAETIAATGAILAGVPMVDRVDLGALATGDPAVVDADAGHVDLPEVTAKPVVSAFLRNRGRFLVVQRSQEVGTFQGRWSAVSGYVEGDEDPKERARIEIQEETAIRASRFRRAGTPLYTRHGTTAFVVHPFLFDVATRAVKLDWENVEFRWVRPDELASFETVPRLADVLSRLLPSE